MKPLMSRIALGWKMYKINNFSRWPCKNRKFTKFTKLTFFIQDWTLMVKLTQLTSFHDRLAKLAISLFPHRPTIPSFIFSSIFADMLAKFRHFYCFQNFGSFHCFIIGPQSPLLNFLVNFQWQACKIVSFYYFCTSLVIFVYFVAEFNTGHISLKL